MRKVGVEETESDSWLEGRIASFQEHLGRCQRQFQAIQSESGLEAALRSQDAQNIAQYSYVVEALEAIRVEEGDRKWIDALAAWAQEAVSQIREGDVPRWKSLGTATILEVVSECCKV